MPCVIDQIVSREITLLRKPMLLAVEYSTFHKLHFGQRPSLNFWKVPEHAPIITEVLKMNDSSFFVLNSSNKIFLNIRVPSCLV